MYEENERFLNKEEKRFDIKIKQRERTAAIKKKIFIINKKI